jgi:hypothetical protein
MFDGELEASLSHSNLAVTACFASPPPSVARIGAARFMTVPATAVATDKAGEYT